MFLHMKILRTYSQCFGEDYCGHRFSREFSRLTPLSRLSLAILSCPMESAVSLLDCVHRGGWLERWREWVRRVAQLLVLVIPSAGR